MGERECVQVTRSCRVGKCGVADINKGGMRGDSCRKYSKGKWSRSSGALVEEFKFRSPHL